MAHRPLLSVTLGVTTALAGCTASPDPAPPETVPALTLVAFDDCRQLTTDLRRATARAVGPYGLPGDAVAYAEDGAVGSRAAPAAGAPAAGGTAPPAGYSGTNVHEGGTDEPDIVKTDGRRIVTVTGDLLRVVDAASRRETGRLRLPGQAPGDPKLLLHGDTALVLATGGAVRGPADTVGPARRPPAPQVVRVDLTGTPRVTGSYQIDGTLVDARLTGVVARVVVRSSPRIDFPEPGGPRRADDGTAANRRAVERAPAGAWLPDWSTTDGGRTRRGEVPCGRVVRPADYTGAALLTVLTFDPARPALGDGDPLTVVADADTVYATGTSLYVAAADRPESGPRAGAARTEHTDLYRFALTGNRRPEFAAAGRVPGRLINQYALSEYDGHLRVAATTGDADAPPMDIAPARPEPTATGTGSTTSGPRPDTATGTGPDTGSTGAPGAAPGGAGRPGEPFAGTAPGATGAAGGSGRGSGSGSGSGADPAAPAGVVPAAPGSGPVGEVPPGPPEKPRPPAVRSSSAVHVLVQRGRALEQTGVVDGLGRGERIYAVRFLGPRGYVVTFRQTDPLYSIDLADPARPRVTGELKITGYSAHLQPLGDGRLVGVGQEADTTGRRQGMQVSLFDVADPARPARLAQHHVPGGQTEAEWDPHALLWWQQTRLLVVPVDRSDGARRGAGALALRVTDGGITEVGTVTHPATDGYPTALRRALVVGDTLWTLSDAGLAASGLTTLQRADWLPV